MGDFGEFKRGWRPLLAGMVGVGTGLTGIVFYSHGVFVVPVSTEMGWSRGETQFAFSFVMMSALITAPLVGMLIDRYGSRTPALGSMMALAVAFAGLSSASESIWSYYAAWMIMSVVGAGTLPVTWTRAVNRWFDRRRGLALGITMVGTGLSATIGPILATWLIGEVGLYHQRVFPFWVGSGHQRACVSLIDQRPIERCPQDHLEVDLPRSEVLCHGHGNDVVFRINEERGVGETIPFQLTTATGDGVVLTIDADRHAQAREPYRHRLNT